MHKQGETHVVRADKVIVVHQGGSANENRVLHVTRRRPVNHRVNYILSPQEEMDIIYSSLCS